MKSNHFQHKGARPGNQQGFSLVEVMLVMGLMGMAAMAFISMQKMQARGQATASAQFETFNLIQEIQLTLLNSKACLNTVSGIEISEEAATLEVIRGASGNERFRAGEQKSGAKVMVSKMSLTPQDIELGVAGPGLVDLNLTLEKLSDQAQGSKHTIQRIPLYVSIDESNNITDCFSTYEAAVLKAKEEMCRDLGGLFSAKKCQSISPKLNDQETVCDSKQEGLMRYSALTKSVFLCNGQKWMESINFEEIGVKADGTL